LRLRVAAFLPALALAALPAQADEAGRKLFEECRACHSLDLAKPGMAGPHLSGLIGRKVASTGFDHSPVMERAEKRGDVWTKERLDAFLTDPAEMYPGLWMSARGIADASERAALIRYLASASSAD
jgi:cytochrome c